MAEWREGLSVDRYAPDTSACPPTAHSPPCTHAQQFLKESRIAIPPQGPRVGAREPVLGRGASPTWPRRGDNRRGRLACVRTV